MKSFFKSLFNLVFGIAVDTATDSIQTARTTFKAWAYLSIALFGSFVLAILYGLYAMIF